MWLEVAWKLPTSPFWMSSRCRRLGVMSQPPAVTLWWCCSGFPGGFDRGLVRWLPGGASV